MAPALTVSPDWVRFCEHDSAVLLAEVARRWGSPHGPPAEVVYVVLEDLLDIVVLEQPLNGVLALSDYDTRCVRLNRDMAQLVRPNTNLEGLRLSTLAHELAHFRAPHHEVAMRALGRSFLTCHLEMDGPLEEEAQYYAGAFLVPLRLLAQDPVVQRWRQTETSVDSDTLWVDVLEVAQRFRVTGAMMAKRLHYMGVLEKWPESGRQLRLCHGGWRSEAAMGVPT